MEANNSVVKDRIRIFSEIQANEVFMNQLFRNPVIFGNQHDRLMSKFKSANDALYKSIDLESLDCKDDLTRYAGGFRSSFNSHPS